jgi:hypothetical protein
MDNHIILTLGRSGSTTLLDLLNQHPEILNFGEVLGDWAPIRKVQKKLPFYRGNDRAYLDAILANNRLVRTANTVRTFGKIRNRNWSDIKRLDRISTIGFKEFSLNFIKYNIYDYVKNRPHLKVIGLCRTNAVDRMISNEFLEKTGVIELKSSDKKEQTRKLCIDPATVLEKLDVIERENNDLRRMLEVLPKENLLWIQYDDLFSSPERTLQIVREAYAFLGVPDHAPQVRMRKILKRDPLSALENGEDLRKVIAASRFAGYLHNTPEKVVQKRRADRKRVYAELVDL